MARTVHLADHRKGIAVNRDLWLFAATGLLVALLLAVFVAPHASTAPDGLERVAADKGFLEKGEARPLWRHALMPDYLVQQLGEGAASTAVAGLMGTLCTFMAGFMLARMLRGKTKPPSPPSPDAHSPHGPRTLDPRAKIIAMVAALVICVSTPAAQYAALAAYFVVLCGAFALCGISARIVARRLLAVLPMVLLCAAFIPFLKHDGVSGGYSLGIGGLHVSRSGLLVLWNIAAKATLGIGLITLLTETTPFPMLLRGLEQLHCPKLGILLLAFCQRFLYVLRDETLRMKRAADARGFRGRWLWHAPVLGRMIGSLFLRGYERGERVYLAMASRGFSGVLPAPGATPAMARTDRIFLGGTLAVFLALRIVLP